MRFNLNQNDKIQKSSIFCGCFFCFFNKAGEKSKRIYYLRSISICAIWGITAPLSFSILSGARALVFSWPMRALWSFLERRARALLAFLQFWSRGWARLQLHWYAIGILSLCLPTFTTKTRRRACLTYARVRLMPGGRLWFVAWLCSFICDFALWLWFVVLVCGLALWPLHFDFTLRLCLVDLLCGFHLWLFLLAFLSTIAQWLFFLGLFFRAVWLYFLACFVALLCGFTFVTLLFLLCFVALLLWHCSVAFLCGHIFWSCFVASLFGFTL